MSKNEGTQRWEESDFPILCSSCLGPNPAIRMTRESFGQECKVCLKPHTVFRWCPGAGCRFRRTEICRTCAQLKDVCQSCLFDLKYGLPVQVRDAVLQIKETVPKAEVNREYFMAVNAERLAKGIGGLPDYDRVDPAARAVLEGLSERVKRQSDDPAVAKRNLPPVCSFYAKGTCTRGDACPYRHELSTEAPPSLKSYRARYYGEDDRLANRMIEKLLPEYASAASSANPRAKPVDASVTALFATGIKSTLTDAHLHSHFGAFGKVRRVVRPNHSCAVIEFADRREAEAAAEHCLGQFIIAGVPLRVAWAKAKQNPSAATG